MVHYGQLGDTSDCDSVWGQAGSLGGWSENDGDLETRLAEVEYYNRDVDAKEECESNHADGCDQQDSPRLVTTESGNKGSAGEVEIIESDKTRPEGFVSVLMMMTPTRDFMM
jgi:hypothetical protein